MMYNFPTYLENDSTNDSIGTKANNILLGIHNFLNSAAFKWLLAILIISLVLFVLFKIYMKIRGKMLKNIVYSRSFSEQGIYCDDTVELIETVRNTGFFPLLWVDIESCFYNELQIEYGQSNADKSMQYHVSRFNLLPYMQIRRHHKIRCTARGVYTLHTVTIYNKDNPIYIESEAEIYVYPKVIPLQISNLAVGRFQGEYLSMRPLFQDPFSFSGIRDYRYGDSLSQINFKASSRVPMTGRSGSALKVNNREYCASRKLMVAMNFHIPVDTIALEGATFRELAENGLSYCSAIIRDAIYNGFQVSFMHNSKDYLGKLTAFYDFSSMEDHLYDILKGMAELSLSDGGSFLKLLDDLIEKGMSDTEMILFQFVDIPDVRDRLAILEQMGNSVQAITLEPDSFQTK